MSAILLTGLHNGAQALADLSAITSVVEKAKGWIMVQPREASVELASLVTEILKAPRIVNQAANALLGLIDKANPTLSGLGELASGELLQDVELRRPHCHDIKLIADRYLSQVLQAPGVGGANAQDLADALGPLFDADRDLFMALVRFAEAIVEIAREVQLRVTQDRKAEAAQMLKDVAPSVLAAQRKANDLAYRLAQLQVDFRCKALGIDSLGV